MGTSKHPLVFVSTYSFRGISTIQATSRLLGTPGHIHIMSETTSTGAPRWKEQLEAALKNDDAGASNCILHILYLHSNRTRQLIMISLSWRQIATLPSFAPTVSGTGHSCHL